MTVPDEDAVTVLDEWRVVCPDGETHGAMGWTDEAMARLELKAIAKHAWRIGDGQMERCPEGEHQLQRREATIVITHPWEDAT